MPLTDKLIMPASAIFVVTACFATYVYASGNLSAQKPVEVKVMPGNVSVFQESDINLVNSVSSFSFRSEITQ